MDRVERVINILNYLASSGKPCGVTEIGKRLKLDKSSVSRVLSTLEKLKWAVKLPDSTYSLGDRPIEFGLSILSRVDLRKVSQPYLIEMNNTTHETCGLSIRIGIEDIYLDQVESTFPIRHVLPLGTRGPLWSGATGKAMLAYMDKGEVDEIIENLRKSGEVILASGKTLDVSELLEEIADVRKLGFAVTSGERSTAATAVASPIIDYNNKVIGCIGITGPLPRLSEEIARGFGPPVKQAAQNISIKLGSSSRL